MEYFEDYADTFNLKAHIKFGVKVLSVHPVGKAGNEQGAGSAHDGPWEVVYTDALHPSSDNTFKQTFEQIIIATGHHWKPMLPKFEGLEDFKGKVMHSHYYREAHPFKDQRCLVVGIGNSAVDAAVELSFHATQVHLSTRRSAWVAPRYAITGAPGDQVLTR